MSPWGFEKALNEKRSNLLTVLVSELSQYLA